MVNIDMARGWYERGKDYGEEKEIDVFNKFIYFWICLNMFYGKEDGKDREKCVNWFDKKKEQILHLPATNSFISFIQKRGGIINESKEENDKDKHNIISSSEDINGIAHSLYTVRCNLFHGDKELYDPSNKELLQESSKLLDDILKQFI